MTIVQSFIWCGLITLSTMNVALAATYRCYYDSMDNYLNTSISNTLGILPCLNKTRDTVIVTFGFKGTPRIDAITSLISALISLNKYNVVLLNWEQEAQGIFPNIFGYPFAVESSKSIAQVAGEGVVQLIQNGTSPDSIKLIGFSLGAHLMGWLGEKVQSNGYNLSSIYGLEPAGLGFETSIMEGLNPSQAKLVFGVHTNAGDYGTVKSVGIADFWVNCANNLLQPGCPSGFFLPLSKESLCSHALSCKIFAEALRNPTGFPAARSDSCNSWTSQNTSSAVINYLGFSADPGKQGNFYLSTNPQTPYSKGQAGITPN